MQFVNNYLQQLTLPAGATTAALALPDGEYVLTLAEGLVSTRWEIVRAVVAGGAATLTRGQEGTGDQAWPEGSLIYCALTAGLVAQLFQRIAVLEEIVMPAPEGQRLAFETEPYEFTAAGFGTEYGAAFGTGEETVAVGIAMDLFGQPAELVVWFAGRYQPDSEAADAPADFISPVTFRVPSDLSAADLSSITMTVRRRDGHAVTLEEPYAYTYEGEYFLSFEGGLPFESLPSGWITPGAAEIFVTVTGEPVLPA